LTPTPFPRRAPGFLASDRLLARVRRVVAAQPFIAGSLALHALFAVAALQWHGASESERAASFAALQATQAAHDLATTQGRELARRVERMEDIRRRLEEAAGTGTGTGATPPAPASAASASGDASPAALAARAEALTAAIDAAERRLRVATLVRLTGLSPADAARDVEARAASAPRPARGATPAETIERLERRAQEVLEARRSLIRDKQEGVRVTSVGRAVGPETNLFAAPASGPTGQSHPADGIPRSRLEQLASVIRTGPAQGRVGVVGVAGGRSVNLEGVQGVAGGREARPADPAPIARFDAGRPVNVPGRSLDLTEIGPNGKRDGATFAEPAAIDVATMRAGAGRLFGPGGTWATRAYLDSWYVAGPFAGQGAASLDAVYPPEEDVDLDGTYRGLGARVLTWKYATRGFYPFVPPDVADNAVYYAYTELRVEQDRDVWLDIGADDDSKLWLDGRLVWTSAPGDKPWYHPPYYLRDEQVASLALTEGHRRVHLARGRHRLLFKLCNYSDRAFFSVVVAP
jgi:hypothetical protein